MKLDNLRILGVNYRVDFESSIEKGWNSAGRCDGAKGFIKVCTEVNNADHQKSVLLHEIIETLDYRLELKLDHNVITSLESGLISVFLDNPQLMEYFNDGI